MFKFRNEKGLTLIELLITISVLAVVSAIALPVINNVVTSSNSNALQQSIKDADAFIKKYSASGVVLYDGLRTITGYVDSDGDNVIEANEKMDSLTLDSKYSMSVAGSAALGGSYTNGGVTSATITSSAASGGSTNTPSTGFTTTLVALNSDIGGGDFGGTGSCNWASGTSLSFYCGLSTNAQTAIAGLQQGTPVEVSYYDWNTSTVVVAGTYTVNSVNLTGTPMSITFNEPINIPGDFRQLRF